jgi:hypothetical protein
MHHMGGTFAEHTCVQYMSEAQKKMVGSTLTFLTCQITTSAADQNFLDEGIYFRR